MEWVGRRFGRHSSWRRGRCLSTRTSALGAVLARGRTSDIHALGRDAVVKVLRSGFPSELIQIEADKTRAIATTGVPAPRILDVTEVDGRPALVAERVDGDSLLNRLLDRPRQMVPLARLLADLHTDLATVHVETLPGLKAKLAERIGTVTALSAEAKRSTLTRLSGLPENGSLCHGDFHPGNVILGARGPVIVDWLDATRGPGAADAARSHLLFSVAPPPQDLGLAHRTAVVLGRTLFGRTYLAHYRRRTGEHAEAIAAWTPVVAAARLSEGFDGEAERLLALVGRGIARPPARSRTAR